MMRLINILSFVSIGLLNIQFASLFFILKNFISSYSVTRVQFIFISLLLNFGLLLCFDRGVDWYRILESFEDNSLVITKPFRFFISQIIGASVTSFIVYWLMIKVIFYFNIYWLARTLLESSSYSKNVTKNSVNIKPLMFVSFALFPISTVVSFESAAAMSFILCMWMRGLNNAEVRWIKHGCFAFLIHPGGMLGLILIKPILGIGVVLLLFLLSDIGLADLQTFKDYAYFKFINYIYGPWSFYAGIGELISPVRAIALLLLFSMLSISSNKYLITNITIKVFLTIVLIAISTVPFRTIYLRIGDPLLILTLLKISLTMSNFRMFYIACIFAMFNTQNLYWFIGWTNNMTIKSSSISYIEEVLKNIELGPTENVYRGNLIDEY